jgi:hypothetical protein
MGLFTRQYVDVVQVADAASAAGEPAGAVAVDGAAS